mgnify:FL=1
MILAYACVTFDKMRFFKIFILLLFSHSSFSQNEIELKADYEMQGYFKDYSKFNIDSLKREKFKIIKQIDLRRTGFRFERCLQNHER